MAKIDETKATRAAMGICTNVCLLASLRRLMNVSAQRPIY